MTDENCCAPKPNSAGVDVALKADGAVVDVVPKPKIDDAVVDVVPEKGDAVVNVVPKPKTGDAVVDVVPEKGDAVVNVVPKPKTGDAVVDVVPEKGDAVVDVVPEPDDAVVDVVPKIDDAVVGGVLNAKLTLADDGNCVGLLPKPEQNGELTEGCCAAVVLVEFVCTPAADPKQPKVGASGDLAFP